MPVRPGLPPVPFRCQRLPIDERGYPVPWFVQWMHPDGTPCEEDPDTTRDRPEFRIADSRKWMAAVRHKLCWVCGEPLGRWKAFVIGPMCAVNRITSEPPCHLSCAQWSAQACPFLSKPQMVRRENDLPEEKQEPGGVMIKRNPGVILVWVTDGYYVNRSRLFELGAPHEMYWYAEGRKANRAEIDESIRTGLPALMQVAEMQGPEAVREVNASLTRAYKLLPLE